MNSFSVSTSWRHLVTIAEISPARRGLFNLYFRIIKSRAFHLTRPWILDNLRPFDQQAYVNTLLEQHNYVPEDFRTWILEWPAKAVIANCWPGLPANYYAAEDYEQDGTRILFEGCNWLRRCPPVVHTVLFTQEEDPREIQIPALLVWEMGEMTWLVLREKPICPHAVYRLVGARYDGDVDYPSVDRDGGQGFPEVLGPRSPSSSSEGDPNLELSEESDGEDIVKEHIGKQRIDEEDIGDGSDDETSEEDTDDESIGDGREDIDTKNLHGDYKLSNCEIAAYSSWTYWLIVAARIEEERPEPKRFANDHEGIRDYG
ncbi:hypothetical protein MVEN_01792700 [Mycena venus]|uniref:Uncharacterized protein n=1 Tax=Mycena venus TaxID=2733690 RepID=A0A8H7CLF5_9AGAR|nr:hypothetical protein MVEN_01792700 [Mycena venus]